jgi:hypothetical protein
VDVRDRLSALRRESSDRLRALPSKREEEGVLINGRICSVITWHDEPTPGSHRIVIAIYEPATLGMATRVTAEGFVLEPDGTTRSLTDEEMNPFQ